MQKYRVEVPVAPILNWAGLAFKVADEYARVISGEANSTNPDEHILVHVYDASDRLAVSYGC